MSRTTSSSDWTREHKSLVAYLVAGCVLLASAFVVGISDNLPGILLCYAGLCSLILAWIHRWHKPWSLVYFAAASFVGIFVFAVLHNLFHGLEKLSVGAWAWAALPFQILDVASFLVALLVCPAGVVAALLASILAVVKHLRQRRQTA